MTTDTEAPGLPYLFSKHFLALNELNTETNTEIFQDRKSSLIHK